MMRSIPFCMAATILSGQLAIGQTVPPAAAPAAPPTSQPAGARDVLNDMLKSANADKIKPLQPVTGNPVIDKTTVNPVAPGANTLQLMREGSYIVDRTGRLSKTADGQFELTFESDGQSMQDPPVLLLPSLKLMLMEDQRNQSSRDAKFRVTGMVTEYKGRNYLLLDKVIVISP